MSEVIHEQDAAELYQQDMVKYLIIVNRRRAFPEITDGLKPVQRKILYDMLTQGANSFKDRIKSSAIVGDTMKQYYGHGDMGLYGAIEPMANWYKCKVPLVAAKGNWGDLMGHGPAAARYTEAGLSDFCYDCILSELKEAKTSVDWIDNYRRTTQEPEYLPVKVPLLLINGSFGIGVGLNTNIPSHNLIEVCEAARTLLRNPSAKILLYPDHCQPCKVIGEKKDFEHICRTGSGRYKVRGMVEVGEEKGYPMVYIKSLPDNVYSTAIVEKLNTMYANKELPMIQDISDATGQTVDIRIKLKKGADPGYMKQILYTKTQVQATMSVNFEVVKGNDPGRFGYKEYLLNFIENRKMVKFRLYCNKLKVASTRYHQLDAYIKLIESGEIDNVIALIKKQTKIDETELQEFLIKRVHVTDIQARFILDTDIRKLSKGYLNKYKEEFKILTNNMKFYQTAITDNGKIIVDEIDKELQEISKKYGTPRICPIIKESDDSNIPKGVFKVVITKRNFLRKVVDTDKVGVVRGDDPKFIVRADNTENILLFDNMGKVFKMPVSKIPLVDKNGAGTDIRILNRSMTADIIAAYYEPTIQKVIDSGRKHYFVVASKNNSIKKLDMEDFLNVAVSGLRYSAIKDNDEVAGIALAPADLDIVIFSKQKALRTSVKNIPLLKRNATGSKAMATKNDIEGISVLYPDEDYVAVVTEKGKVNKFQMSALSPHARGCAGINVIKLKDHDSIKSIYGASDRDTLRIITSNQTIEVPVADIQSRSPVAAGDNIPLKGASIIRVDLMYQQK